MTQHDIYGLYSDSWQGDIVPEAFAHPAKFSRGLIRWIINHLLEQGYIKPGSTVVDPFGGVGLGALDCMINGLHFRACELEEKFVALARANFELWQGRYSQWLPGWGTAEIFQGDSRLLCQVMSEAGAVLSSPPYQGSVGGGGDQLGLMSQGRAELRRTDRGKITRRDAHDYGSAPGQLGAMKEGQPPDAIISSPPYADAVQNGEGPGARHDYKFHSPDNATKQSSRADYGDTAGQLGSMAVVGSPPFEATNRTGGATVAGPSSGMFKGLRREEAYHTSTNYGSTNGNIGNDKGDTFWQAARVIVEQCYQLLPPGGVAVWVTGNFRRDGKVVDFGSQWLSLCESVGFVGLEKITAWKCEPRPAQADIFGNIHDRDIHRVSFFRRLDNQKNPGNEILSEEVWVVGKPL